MPKPSTPHRIVAVLAALAASALVAAGCGGTTTADVDRGREIFKQKCGTCHTMAQAGTTAENGPDLDDAFASARESGQNDATIEGVVVAQVEYPRPMSDNPAASMPAMIIEGQDLKDVAAYVGRYAGVPGAAPPRVPGGPGAQVFANSGCGTCHTLAAAGAGGVTGPDLDEALPGQSLAMIHDSIVDPNATIPPGFKPDVMPLNYGQLLTKKELEDLVEFLAQSTSGGKGS